MKFKHGTRRRALEYEKDIAQTWKKNKTFEKSVENRPADNAYVFYDGPPFITGVPHHGTLLSSIVKDAVPRYWTMKGKRVERVWGWDCHGLPAENFVEKQLSITDRRQIVTTADAKPPLDRDGNELPTISLETYITKARESMVANSETWEGVIDRIGRWVDFRGAYRTMDKDFMESVWWAFQQLYEAGKIYEGEKVLMYDTRFATPVSKAEVTMDNDAYQTVTDPSLYAKFRLLDKTEASDEIVIEQIDLNDGADHVKLIEQTSMWPQYTEKVQRLSAEGKAVLFAAKIGDEYAGRVTLWMNSWKDDNDDAGASQYADDYYPNLPAVNALEVREEFRRRGVASKLLQALEKEAHARGYESIGLGVETDNQPALELYKKMGYHQQSLGGDEEYRTWWQETDVKGEVRKFDLTCYFMMKDLHQENDENLGEVKLRLVSESDGDVERSFLQSVPPDENGFENPASAEDLKDDASFKMFIKDKVKRRRGEGLPEGQVPDSMYWIERNGEIVGVGKLRHYLNDRLRNAHGHIGIGGIKPEYRGLGIGTKALSLLMAEAKKMGEAKVLLTIDEENSASRRMAEKNGAKLEKIVDGECFYWADTDTSSESAEDVFILAWTTTPWTLPANLMLAVSSELTYCEMLVGGERLIVAEEALERVMKDEKNKPLEYEVVRKFPGSELVGKSYEPLDTGSSWPENDAVHKVYAADFVSHESGTGIVHCAPAYGEDDFELAEANGIAAFHVIDDNGYYFDTNYKGLEVWENNKRIAKDLMEKGIAWRIEYIRHEYPFNPRSKQRIMYRAIPSWFFDVQGQKPLMLEQNENINWFPEHLKHGRFQKNIEQAPDWNLSRDRFWATAMPVWKGDKGTVKVVGSYTELKELSGVELDDYHRPWVDDITFEIDGEMFTRIDKVLDGWFESGSMPFAQLHYPFENQEKFEKNYPADFIVEYVGQVRAWFYYVHLVNTTLADVGAFGEDSQKPQKNAFKNVITTGVVAGNDGRKMSKSLGNFTDPNELMDRFSADSLRFLLLSSPLLKGEDFDLHDKDVGDVARKLSMVWNMYDFFTMYAEVDGWEFDATKPLTLNPDDATNPLDKWIISRVHQLNEHITEHMDAYDIPSAMEPILPFLDDASNWYVRRSRRRFWKSEDDGDKNDAYRTLHYVLLKLSVILAPFTPFLAEELYQKLGGGEESVHLLDWPTNYMVDQAVVDEMAKIREVINDGLSQRAAKGVKVRQPLLKLSANRDDAELLEKYEDIICEELNVKFVEGLGATPEKPMLDFHITPELKREGLMREVIRHVQSARKQAGLNVDDHIVLGLASEDEELMNSLDEFQKTIAEETLTDQYANVQDGYSTTAKVEGAELFISLKKA